MQYEYENIGVNSFLDILYTSKTEPIFTTFSAVVTLTFEIHIPKSNQFATSAVELYNTNMIILELTVL